jgi:hypothetical protein
VRFDLFAKPPVKDQFLAHSGRLQQSPGRKLFGDGQSRVLRRSRRDCRRSRGGERTYAHFLPPRGDGRTRPRLCSRPAHNSGPSARLDAVARRQSSSPRRWRCPPSVREGEAAVFLFPDSARDVRLASNTFVPARIGLGDSSELGVFPIRARLRGLRRRGATHSLDDPRLAGGLHNDEAMVGAHWLGPRAS